MVPDSRRRSGRVPWQGARGGVRSRLRTARRRRCCRRRGLGRGRGIVDGATLVVRRAKRQPLPRRGALRAVHPATAAVATVSTAARGAAAADVPALGPAALVPAGCRPSGRRCCRSHCDRRLLLRVPLALRRHAVRRPRGRVWRRRQWTTWSQANASGSSPRAPRVARGARAAGGAARHDHGRRASRRARGAPGRHAQGAAACRGLHAQRGRYAAEAAEAAVCGEPTRRPGWKVSSSRAEVTIRRPQVASPPRGRPRSR